jgi:hypothetical protein
MKFSIHFCLASIELTHTKMKAASYVSSPRGLIKSKAYFIKCKSPSYAFIIRYERHPNTFAWLCKCAQKSVHALKFVIPRNDTLRSHDRWQFRSPSQACDGELFFESEKYGGKGETCNVIGPTLVRKIKRTIYPRDHPTIYSLRAHSFPPS